MEKVADDIYRIKIDLPKTPLKSLNVYLIRGERNLLFDTGFNVESCYRELADELDELGVDLGKTDIFVSHLHSDHSGLAYRLQREGTRVYISETDFAFMDVDRMVEGWKEFDRVFLCNGFPEDELALLPTENVARSFSAPRNCGFTFVNDGDTLEYGGRRLTVAGSPGHTPGHLCLYDEADSLCFLADHVLFDITPNIAVWPGTKDSLADYFDSLKKFKTFNIKTPLPGHREVSGTVNERADAIIAHHGVRLEEALSVVAAADGLTAYEIAPKMSWRIRAKSWDEFPTGQKWFATSETLAHLEYLENRGEIERYEEDGKYKYMLRKGVD